MIVGGLVAGGLLALVAVRWEICRLRFILNGEHRSTMPRNAKASHAIVYRCGRNILLGEAPSSVSN